MIIRGSYLLLDPAQGSESIIKDGAIYVKDDKIEEIAGYSYLKKKYPGEEVIGNGKQLVMPGFIDAHSHGWGLTPLQSGSGYDFLEKWLLDTGLNVNIDPCLSACYSAIKHIESGCTTMHHNHLTKNPADIEGEINKIINGYKEAGIRFAFSLGVKDQNRFTYDDNSFMSGLPEKLQKKLEPLMHYDKQEIRDAYFELFEKIYNKHNSEGCKVFFGPVAPQWCSDELLEEIREKAGEYKAKIHLHVLQTILQKIYGERKYGKSLVNHLHDIGLTGKNVTYGHAVWLTDKDIELMASTGTSVTHHVSCNLNMRNGIQPVMSLKDAGVLIGLGLDDKGLNDDEDYIQEMRLVYKMHRLAGFDLNTSVLTPEDVIKMSTVNAASVTGFEGTIGVLEKGKKADIILVNLEKMTEPWVNPDIPLLDIFMHRAKGMDVDTVIIDGKLVMCDREIITINKEYLIKEIVKSASKGISLEQEKYNLLISELKPYYYDFYKNWQLPGFDPFYVFNSKK